MGKYVDDLLHFAHNKIMKGNDSIFLTQGLTTLQARKTIVTNFVAQSDSSEVAEASRYAEELLKRVQEIRPQEDVSLFRQMRRQVKHARIQGES